MDGAGGVEAPDQRLTSNIGTHMNEAIARVALERFGINLTDKDVERFWSKVDKNGPIPAHNPDAGPCWVWTRGCYPDGYPQFSVRLKSLRGGILGFILGGGTFENGLVVRHVACRNKKCVNPSHLRSGTQQDNIDDRSRDGTTACGCRNGSYTHPEKVRRGASHHGVINPMCMPRGQNHHAHTKPWTYKRGEQVKASKVTDDIVREIRRAYSAKELNLTQLAEKFQIYFTTVHKIIARQTWKHVV